MASLAFWLCMGRWHRDIALYRCASFGCCADPGSSQTDNHNTSWRYWQTASEAERSTSFCFVFFLHWMVCVCACCSVLRLIWILVQKSVLGRAGLGPMCILQFPSLGCMLFVSAWFSCTFAFIFTSELVFLIRFKKAWIVVLFLSFFNYYYRENYHTHTHKKIWINYLFDAFFNFVCWFVIEVYLGLFNFCCRFSIVSIYICL